VDEPRTDTNVELGRERRNLSNESESEIKKTDEGGEGEEGEEE
jgi:hypothetical protein